MTSRHHNNNNNTSSRSTQRRVYNRVLRHDGGEEEEAYDTVVIVNDEVHQPPESQQLPSAASSTTPSSSSRSLPVTLSSALSSRGRNLLARTTRRPAASTAPTPRSYHRVAASDDDVVAPEPPVVTDSSPTLTSISSNSSLASKSVDDEENDEENSLAKEGTDEKATNLTVTILDYTQKKFTIPAHTQWTIAQFKVASARIHKVPVGLQRLIFRGKLLADETTLHDAGIVESDLIVHLFPKPRVVINSNNNNNNNNASNSACTASGDQGDNDNEGNDEEGARVPTIVMDANEAEQRAHILVLGSSEYIEAQNNVKLFSFMLLIISSIELLNLLAIALGVPQDEQGSGGGGSGAFAPGAGLDIDDIFPPQYNDDDWTNPNRSRSNHSSYGSSGSGGGGYPHNSTNMAVSLLYQSWSWMNTVDLIISLAGVYVAITGIQASTENTLRLARVYLIGTFLVGVAWLLFNYFMTVEINEAVEEDHRENHPNDDLVPDLSTNDIYAQALSVMVLPAMVWVMCCLRAAQFHHLLREAEEEAETRIQAELERSQNESGETNNAAMATTPSNGGSGANENDEEMALSTSASNQGSNNNNLPAQPRRHRITEPILT